ncbi:olfactory receptor 2AT4-like [Amia ocellicauda]|uniref:olfactory receptor 2AT4-like n=1 Tax=Amia ocellicauda TaxID=2972642 RepID=UPI003464C458
MSMNDQWLLEIEGFDIPHQSIYPVFFLMLFVYLVILLTNVGVLVLIITERSLHQPMYILFCNLSANDLIGNTVLIPRLMSQLLSSKRYITFVECVIQAFCSHTFGCASHLILMIALNLRLSRCRSVILNAICDNASLFKLSCDDVTINNIYGLFVAIMMHVISMGSITITYAHIVLICLTNKNKNLNSKALQTCATHLVVYLVMLLSGFLSFILHRFPVNRDIIKLSYILFYVLPANFNPIIYGLKTKDLRNKLVQIFSRKVSHL